MARGRTYTREFKPGLCRQAVGGEKTTAARRTALSLSFSAGVITVYALLGVAFATLGLALMTLLNRSIWLWFALLAPFMWIMGLRLAGVLRFDMPLPRRAGSFGKQKGWNLRSIPPRPPVRTRRMHRLRPDTAFDADRRGG